MDMRIPNLHHSDPYWLQDTEYMDKDYGYETSPVLWAKDHTSSKGGGGKNKWVWIVVGLIILYITLVILTNES